MKNNQNISDIISSLNLKEENCFAIGYKSNFNEIYFTKNLKYLDLNSNINFFKMETEEILGLIKNIIGNNFKISCIIVTELLEYSVFPEKILKAVCQLSKYYNIPVIISVPNITHKDIAFKLMEGRFDYTDYGSINLKSHSFFTENRIDTIMEKYGLKQIIKSDIVTEITEQHFPYESTVFNESLAHQFLDWFKTTADKNADVKQFIRAYAVSKNLNLKKEKNQLHKPFLSVIMRTQGRRPETLSEVLRCLASQSNNNFEVLIMGHNLDDNQRVTVTDIIQKLPKLLRNRVKLIEVKGGGRARPLNEGFKNSSGEYISILDDDDLVFNNWVSVFYELSKNFYGRILHSYTTTQEWEVIKSESGKNIPMAVGVPHHIYCKDFDYIQQLYCNAVPTFSFAFPNYIFHQYNICVDENLSFTEDWDFLQRIAPICGVADSQVITGTYRLWTNSENSLTLYTGEEREEIRQLIQERFNNVPMLLPKGYAKKLIEKSNIFDASIYLNYGDGFSSDKKISVKELLNCEYNIIFDGFPKNKTVQAIRFDPSQRSGITVSDFKIEVNFEDTTKEYYYFSDINKTNGQLLDDKIAFFLPDPKIEFNLRKPKVITLIKIGFKIFNINDDILKKFQRNPTLYLDKLELYLSDENGEFSEKNKLAKSLISDSNKYKIIFKNLERFNIVSKIRLDPSIYSSIRISDLTLYINFYDGTQTKYTVYDNEITNGEILNQSIIFLTSDPQISFNLTLLKKISSIVIEFEKSEISDKTLKNIIKKEPIEYMDKICLYIDNGNDYTEENMLIFNSYGFGKNKIEDINLSSFGKISSIRIDPSEYPYISLSDFTVSVTCENNENTILNLNNSAKTNGIIINDNIIFINEDPQISFDFTFPQKILSICISFNKSKLSENFIDELVEQRANRKYHELLNIPKTKKEIFQNFIKEIRK